MLHGARTRTGGIAIPGADTNTVIASLLRDLASVQTSPHSRFGYKRAARAILNLDRPIESLRRPDGTLPKIPSVGPSSLRVIVEVLETGGSPTVERAVAERRLQRAVPRMASDRAVSSW